MKKHEQLMLIAAKSNIPVLLQGESGVGKEIAAKFIHEHSPRNEGPFIALNCGAIARNLAESLLEGAKKGSYTGAASDHRGIVQAANGGTLFLDEIGEMPFDMQSKLLRILQEHSVLPLGATQNEPVDFRLVCATNRDLQNEVHDGNFRKDLFFRLNAFPIVIPPLRKRDDFADIATAIWNDITARTFAVQLLLRKWEIRALSRYDWPGNIRQLKNVLQRYALLILVQDDKRCQGKLHIPSANSHTRLSPKLAIYSKSAIRTQGEQKQSRQSAKNQPRLSVLSNKKARAP